MTELTIASAFLLGLLGSSHCMGMCGGISAALSANTQGQNQALRLISYNTGRILTYTLIGALAGSLGALLTIHPLVGVTLRGLAGLLLISMGFYITGWWLGLTRLEAVGTHLWRRIQPFSKRWLPVRSPYHAFRLGLIWGLLPCGLVYSTISWALASANWQQSALLMASFGFGTLPAMLATGFAGEHLFRLLKQQRARVFAGSLIILMGLITLWVPISHLQHHGHHSPHSPQPSQHHGHH